MVAAAELALVMPAIVQVKDMVPSLIETRHDISNPVVVPVRSPVLNASGAGGRGGLCSFGFDGRKIKGRLRHVVRVQLPRRAGLPLRIAEGEVVVEKLPVNVHGPANARKIEHNVMLPCRAFSRGQAGCRRSSASSRGVRWNEVRSWLRGPVPNRRASGTPGNSGGCDQAPMLEESDGEHSGKFEDRPLTARLAQVDGELHREGARTGFAGAANSASGICAESVLTACWDGLKSHKNVNNSTISLTFHSLGWVRSVRKVESSIA